jgi:hypothetical protein
MPAFPAIDLSKFELPKFDMTKVDLPKFELPKFDMPKIDMPKIDMPKIDMPKVELPEVDMDRVSAFARDAAYVGIGLTVLAVQQAQVRRRELQSSMSDGYRKLVDTVS